MPLDLTDRSSTLKEGGAGYLNGLAVGSDLAGAFFKPYENTKTIGERGANDEYSLAQNVENNPKCKVAKVGKALGFGTGLVLQVSMSGLPSIITFVHGYLAHRAGLKPNEE